MKMLSATDTLHAAPENAVVYSILSNADAVRHLSDGTFDPPVLTWIVLKSDGSSPTRLETLVACTSEGLTLKYKRNIDNSVLNIQESMSHTLTKGMTDIALYVYKDGIRMAEKVVKVVYDGPQGPGYYPAGSYNDKTTYKWNGVKMVPVVECNGLYYALQETAATKTGIKGVNPMTDVANNGGNWGVFDMFQYIFAAVAFIQFAKLGSAVFYEQYMFSQQGIDASGAPVTSEDGYKDFNYNDPMNPSNDFRPNILLDFLTGASVFRKTRVDGDIYGHTVSVEPPTDYTLPEINGRYGMFYMDFAPCNSRTAISKVYKASGGDSILTINGKDEYTVGSQLAIHNNDAVLFFSQHNDDLDKDLWIAVVFPYSISNNGITSVLSKYVTIDKKETITGEKNFTGGMKINGCPIEYNEESGYWKFIGDVLVTGGLTTFGNDSSFKPSTVMDAVIVDGQTITKDETTGALKLKEGAGSSGVSSFNELKNIPKTISGYGITDAKIKDGVITLGSNTIIPLTDLSVSGNNLAYTKNGVVKNITVPYASKAARLSKWNVITITKAADAPTVYKLIADLSNWKKGFDCQWGLIGVMYGHRGGNMSGTCVQKLVAYCGSYSSGEGGTNYELKTDVVTYVRPVIVMYDGVTYLALKMAGSGSAREHVFMGYTENLLPEFIEVSESSATLVHDTEMMVLGGVQAKKAESVAWTNVDGRPSKLSQFTDDVVSGKYLPLGGGTLTGKLNAAKNAGIYADDGSVLISNVDDLTNWDGIRELGMAGVAISNGSYPTVIRTSGNSLYHYRKDRLQIYIILDGSNYSDYLPFLNGTSNHANKESVIYAADYAGISGQVLLSGGSNRAPSWVNQSAITSGACSGNSTTATTSTNAEKLKLTGSSSDGTFRVVFADVAGGAGNYNNLYVDSKEGAGYNPATDTFVASAFNGNGLVYGNGAKADISSAGWYRIAVSTTSSNGGGTYLFSIRRSYYHTNNESYIIAATFDQNGCHFTQIAGHYNTQLITQIRCSYNLDGTAYFDIYYSGTVLNTIFVNGIGNMKLQAPAAATSTLTKTSSTTLTEGFKAGSTKPYALTLYRNSTSGGVYILYGAANQVTKAWAAGSDSEHRFGWFYKDAGTDDEKMWLDNGGNLLVTGSVTVISDARKKAVIGNAELSLQQVAEAPLVEYYYRNDKNKTVHVGSIAQYWAKMNDWFCKRDKDGFYTMELQNAALASAVSVARELSRVKKEYERRIQNLESRLEKLEKLLNVNSE